MSFAGKNLRYLRKLRGWTQEEFANKLKIKSYWELMKKNVQSHDWK